MTEFTLRVEEPQIEAVERIETSFKMFANDFKFKPIAPKGNSAASSYRIECWNAYAIVQAEPVYGAKETYITVKVLPQWRDQIFVPVFAAVWLGVAVANAHLQATENWMFYAPLVGLIMALAAVSLFVVEFSKKNLGQGIREVLLADDEGSQV